MYIHLLLYSSQIKAKKCFIIYMKLLTITVQGSAPSFTYKNKKHFTKEA